MKKSKKHLIIFKIILFIFAIEPFIIYVIKQNNYRSTIDMSLFIIIEYINISLFILSLAFAKKSIHYVLVIIVICYLIISMFIPIYKESHMLPNSHAQDGYYVASGGVEYIIRNIYGIDITNIIDNIKKIGINI